MFEVRPSTIVFILRNELVAYDRQGKAHRQTLPRDCIDLLEIVDKTSYGSVCSRFISTAGLSGKRVLIVVSDDITYHTNAKTDSASEVDAIAKDFSSKLPMDMDKQRIVVYQRPDKTECWGINTELFELLKDRLEAASSKVLAVVPATFFGIQSDQGIDGQQRSILYERLKVRKVPNFMSK